MSDVIFSSAVDRLATLVEEGIRANNRNVVRFLEPAHGTLLRAQSRRHHVIFGRRGSGKSSLLYKSASELAGNGRPTVFVDLEPFKGHHYPDLLISVLIASFTKYHEWLVNEYIPRNSSILCKLIPILDGGRAKGLNVLTTFLAVQVNELRAQLHLADGASLKESQGRKNTSRNKGQLAITGKVPVATSSVEANLAREVEAQTNKEITEEYKRSKQDYLHRKIIDFRAIFSKLAELTGGDCFIFIDDLYHIYRTDQPQLLDYIHRLAKGNSLWMKVGTIRHRSSWYRHEPQPMGLKLGDDADDIDLDLTLENFTTSREFLKKILCSYIYEAKATDIDELLAEGGIDRIVLASGGVTRDFLGIFRRSIDAARERLNRNSKSARGSKIGAEDVNVAAGSYGDIKKQEFQRDTLEDEERLEESFQKIKMFCLDKNKTTIFLVDQDLKSEDSLLVQELIDLRMIHQIKSRLSVTTRPGKAYKALLLDVSQYTGERRRYDIESIDFWKEQNKDAIRKARLVYDPGLSLESLSKEVEANEKRRSAGEVVPDGNQLDMFPDSTTKPTDQADGDQAADQAKGSGRV